jgi:hypothetical protein
MKISHDLKMKIISDKSLSQTVIEYKQFMSYNDFNIVIPQRKEGTFILDLSNDLHLVKECVDWVDSIRDDMLYVEKPQVNVGCFKGIFPIELSPDNKVTFMYQVMDSNGDNWKDWFVMEEKNENLT